MARVPGAQFSLSESLDEDRICDGREGFDWIEDGSSIMATLLLFSSC